MVEEGNDVRLAKIEYKIDIMCRSLDELKLNVKDLVKDYDMRESNCVKLFVNKDQFDPVKKVVYGMVAVILMSVIGGLVALLIRTGR